MNATVTAAAIGVGGSVIVALAAFWANVRNTNKATTLTLRALELTKQGLGLTEQGQVTDRYTKAIEQLGSDTLDVRIGGIYALERVSRDSPRDHPTVMEVLAAFVREHSREQWPKAEPGAAAGPRATRPDVQAAVTVIGRRNREHDRQPINLEGAELILAILTGANLNNSNLAGANLEGANLNNANLTGANLDYAILTGANLDYAILTAANLEGADLVGARLFEANLTDANLTAAKLTGAYLAVANLTDANLEYTILSGANLDGADLTDAVLADADLTGANLNYAIFTELWPVPKGWVRDDSGRLSRASEDTGHAGN